MPKHTIAHYHRNAARFQAQYDSVAAADVHADWASLLQGRTPGRALDVGAGSGRDALWLAQQGWQVTAVEPAQGLRERGQHATGEQVQWCDSQLPHLSDLDTPAQGYDLILLSAVWMHLPPSERPQAFSRLVELLSTTGLLIITLRFGPSDPERPMYAVSVDELAQLAQPQGLVLSVLGKGESRDRLARAEVSWQTVCLHAAGSENA
jgi:SAM-dependent methyltransferase